MKEILKQFEYLPSMVKVLLRNVGKPVLGDEDDAIELNRLHWYANLITQPLTKGMFVPCDEDGNRLGMPVNYDKYANKNKFKLNEHNFSEDWILLCRQYQQALDMVIFEGGNKAFENIEFLKFVNVIDATIEDAINAGVKLKHKGF